MVDRLMRQSLLGDADICLKKVEFNLDPNVPRGHSEATIVGTAYHAGLQELYLARAAGEPWGIRRLYENAYKAFELESDEFTGWETSPQDALGRVCDMLTVYVDENHQWPTEYQVIGVETEFTQPWIEGWQAHGTIDLVLRGPDDIVVLVDHKTAGRKWPANKETARKNNQASYYSYWWWEMTGEMPRFCFDVMNYKGEFERRWTTRTRAEIVSTMDKARAVARLIDLTGAVDLPGNTSSVLCSEKYCSYWDRCPYGAAMNEV